MPLAKEKTYQFKALTDLWTGSVDGKADRLVTTGLLGSIRWWFEVLVRGLGGGACDPSDTECGDRTHCVVCEFFGCTGWARKFRFEVKDQNGQVRGKMNKNNGKEYAPQINKDEIFSFNFTPFRPIKPKEWALLDATLHLIAEYGAIGGKTVFRPSDEPGRANKPYHKDYGLIKITQAPQIDRIELHALKTYVSASQWRRVNHGDFDWASLQYFWCVNGKYLSRQNSNASTFNRVIGRPEAKQQASGNDSWLAGQRPDRRNNIAAESKKVFSFKDQPRTFGFVKPGLIDFNAMQQKLINAWGNNGWTFLTSNKIINQLFVGMENRS